MVKNLKKIWSFLLGQSIGVSLIAFLTFFFWSGCHVSFICHSSACLCNYKLGIFWYHGISLFFYSFTLLIIIIFKQILHISYTFRSWPWCFLACLSFQCCWYNLSWEVEVIPQILNPFICQVPVKMTPSKLFSDISLWF